MAAHPCTAVNFRLEQVDNCLLSLRWDCAVAVTVEDVCELLLRKDALGSIGAVPMLVELNNMVTLSREAFALLASSLDVSAVAAVGSSAVERVLIEHFRAVHDPPYPVAYFDVHDEALSWLHHNFIR